MTKFIKTIILIAFTISTISSSGQDTTKTKKIKEYYITLSGFSPLNISIKYKRQLRNRTFCKLGLVDLSFNTRSIFPGTPTTFPTSSTRYSAGIEFGIEFRKSKTEKFTFYHGPNLSFVYNTNINQSDNPALPIDQRTNTTQTYNGGIPYTLGFLFRLNDHFLLSTEINPGLFITFKETDNGSNSLENYSSNSANFKFSNNNAFLSIVYRL